MANLPQMLPECGHVSYMLAQLLNEPNYQSIADSSSERADPIHCKRRYGRINMAGKRAERIGGKIHNEYERAGRDAGVKSFVQSLHDD